MPMSMTNPSRLMSLLASGTANINGTASTSTPGRPWSLTSTAGAPEYSRKMPSTTPPSGQASRYRTKAAISAAASRSPPSGSRQRDRHADEQRRAADQARDCEEVGGSSQYHGGELNRDRAPCITYDRAVARGADPRIIAIGGGDPLDRKTWSGSASWLASALQRRGVLEAAVDVWPPGVDAVARVASFSVDRQRWRQRYWAQASALDGAIRRLIAITGTRRVRRVDASPDVVLQLGASRFDGPKLGARLRCSYTDTHLTLFLARPDSRLDPSSRLVRKALDRERRAFESLDVIFTMSDWMRESIIADAGQDPDKVVTAGTGANISIPSSAPQRASGPPRFLFVGMQFERKGGRHLLEAFDVVRRTCPDAELWIVGPQTPEREQAGVRWFGRIDRSDPAQDDEIKRLYAEATAFVMPSIFEPAGIVFLEAMAFALPCVGSDCCAMPEFIAREESGLLARRADPEDLAAQLLTLATAPERARQMGLAGLSPAERALHVGARGRPHADGDANAPGSTMRACDRSCSPARQGRARDG